MRRLEYTVQLLFHDAEASPGFTLTKIIKERAKKKKNKNLKKRKGTKEKGKALYNVLVWKQR